MWGSPDVNRIVLLPALFDFLGKCRERGIMVGLSTWYRKDDADTRMTITGPEVMAANWIKTLDLIAEAGYIDSVLYTDLCNEWPGEDWATFVKPHYDLRRLDKPRRSTTCTRPSRWSGRNIRRCRCCSLARRIGPENYLEHDLSDFDLLDPHIWMVQQNDGEFYKLAGIWLRALRCQGIYQPEPESRRRLSCAAGILADSSASACRT